MSRNYSPLMAEMSKEYAHHAPKSAELHRRASHYLVDGGSHALRLMRPFSPRIANAKGAWLEDEDGNRILDFWQGHYANLLGHNPEAVTGPLAQLLAEGAGLQGGFTSRYQDELAEIICRQTGHERVRFTTSGTLATLYAIMLARTYTGRRLVLKVGAGWHGGHFWGLKGVGWHDGFEAVDSEGIPGSVTDEVVITGFNNLDLLHEHFRQHGSELACFILEPVIGAGGLMPATREYIQAARELTEQHGTVLILDEIISGFRYRAGDVAALYGVKADLTTLGKAVGGGMPVAAVAGRKEILNLAGRTSGSRVKFSGGTYSGHPASMLAGKRYLSHLVENEAQIYPALAEISTGARFTIIEAFASEGINVRFAGDRNEALPGNSLHMLLFPYQDGVELNTPEEVRNPQVCDLTLSEEVLQLALLLENVYTVHGLGSTSTAHTAADMTFLGRACQSAAARIKPYM